MNETDQFELATRFVVAIESIAESLKTKRNICARCNGEGTVDSFGSLRNCPACDGKGY